jgi:hypothetical protein
MTKTGMRLVPMRGNSLGDFTPYKIYTVISGTGEANLSEIALRLGHCVHTERSCNVVDDKGMIRFVTLDFFREFRLESGVLYHD